jgi:hypothetical protein
MTTVTVHADIISPDGGGRHQYRYPDIRNILTSIQLTVKNIPKGSVLLLLSENTELEQMVHSGEVTQITRKSNLYLAVESRLSKPFDYNRDEKWLIWLKQYRTEDVALANQRSVPGKEDCRIENNGAKNYRLICE